MTQLHPAFLSRSPGTWLERIAVAHAAVGLTLYRAPLAEIVRDRVIGTVSDHGERATAFWYMIGAPLLWISGRLLCRAEANDDAIAQRYAGSMLVAAGATGAAAMPVSGFWAVVAVGIGALRRSWC